MEKTPDLFACLILWVLFCIHHWWIFWFKIQVIGSTKSPFRWAATCRILAMSLHWDQIPKKQGLYDPSMESDACGVGAVMDMNRKKSRKTLTDARDMAVRMTHRGAKQAHEERGEMMMWLVVCK